MSKATTEAKHRAFYIAKNITAFWARQGAKVTVQIEEICVADGPDSNARKEYNIRSDMKNGLPRKFRPTHVKPQPRVMEA